MSLQMNTSALAEVLSADTAKLVEIALEAGAIVMEVYRTDFDVDFKSDDSPVTEADQRAEAAITEQLKSHWPDINIIAEEAVSAGDIPDHSDRFFLVDPQSMKNRYVEIMNIDFIFFRMKTKFIGTAMNGSSFDSASRHPNRKPMRMMVATPVGTVALNHRGSTKFTAPND